MLAEKDRFNFSTDFLKIDCTNRSISFPVILDWSIESKVDCEEAKRNTTSYACRSPNSECIKYRNGLGYLCNCSKGYEGNPYLEDGCQDIDECKHPDLHPCYGECSNIIGDYQCRCRLGYYSDDPKMKNCTRIDHIPLQIKWATGDDFKLYIFLMYYYSSSLHIKN